MNIARTTLCLLLASAALHTPAAAEQSQQALRQTADTEFRKVGAELNELYGAVLARLDATEATLLRAAQRAWLGYRDANCEAETGQYEGGSMQPMVRLGCLTHQSRQRMEELHRIYGPRLQP
ncbi:MAG TPA: lysozyme inhibitor LprI family protein [Candidatus Binatia bacterium]|nr:lysozyme inhibitor LprI family protein [Candidatus Binatia bacterium]